MPLPPDAPQIASLDLFVSVVQLGSLSAGAHAHGIAQPSASARIRQLERQLGMELLTRGPNGSVPTDAGLLAARWAQRVLDACAELQAAVAALRAEGTDLRVAASYTIAEHLLPRWLGRLHAAQPDTHVELEVVNSTTVLERVRNEDAQLGFIEAPGSTSGLHSTVVGHDELVVVVSPSHPWAGRRGPIDVARLASTPLILREAGSGTREALATAVRATGTSLAPAALELGSTSAVRAAAEEGTGPAVLSRLAVADALAAGRLVRVEVVGLDLRRDLRAVWLPDRAREPAVTALLSTSTTPTG